MKRLADSPANSSFSDSFEAAFAAGVKACNFQASPLQRIEDPWLEPYQIELWLKRDDLLHPIISGNKWRKLKYALRHALALGCDTLISMGGAYSNHLHALAFAGSQFNLNTQAFVRGELVSPLNPTLQDLHDWGMQLEFVSRSEYRQLRLYQDWNALPKLQAGHYWLPEGGAGTYAQQGVAELLDEITLKFDSLCVACGTGATLAGLLTKKPSSAKVIGFAALKNAGFLNSDVARMSANAEGNDWEINHAYHFGGFAEVNDELLMFMHRFETLTSIALDPLYTGKMLFGVYDLIAQGYFKKGQRIIAIHTGGLQGRRSGILAQCGSGGV